MPEAIPSRKLTCADCGESFIAKYAGYCPNCRWRHRGGGKKKKYDWTTERDAYLIAHWDIRTKGRTTEIAAHFGWPRWAINKRAKQLGLARSKEHKEPPWTAEQDLFLRAHVHKRTAHWMWANLPAPRRSETAVIVRLKRLCGSRLVTDAGYTMGQLERVVDKIIGPPPRKYPIAHHGALPAKPIARIVELFTELTTAFRRTPELVRDPVVQDWIQRLAIAAREAQGR